MFENYLKVIWRNIVKNKTFSLINILGLTLGITCCLLIFFTVRYELSFDTHNKHLEETYRIGIRHKELGDKGYATGIPLPVLAAIRGDYPELKNLVTCTYGLRDALVTIGEGPARKKFASPFYDISFIGPEYFNLFDYKWIKGSPASSLANPRTAVLTESQARQYFGNEDAMGKTLRVGNHMDFIVTGLVQDPPVTTSFPFKTMLSFSSLKEYGAFTNWDDWASTYGGGQMYLRLPGTISKETAERYLADLNKKYRDAETVSKQTFILMPVKDIHFTTNAQNYSGRTISKGMIWSMVLVGIFILVTACVNFVNLATAQALRRAREVGVRKVLGSTRGQLLRQYFSETGVLTFLSVLFALILAQLTLPQVAETLNIRSEGVLFFKDPSILAFLLILAVITTILSGFYPALVVSGYQPILALKGKMKSSGSGQSNLRRGLIVLQFTISQVVLLGTLIAYMQMKHFRTMDLGFVKDEIVNVPIPQNDPGKLESLRAKLSSEAGIKNMSFSSFTPMSGSNWQTGFTFENDKDFLDFEVVMRPADTAYVKTYGLELVAGRMYLPSDTIREYVVNETFVRKLGFKNPQDVLGKRLTIGGSDYKLPIVGVIKNFNTYSLHREIIPCVLTSLRENYYTLGIKLAAGEDPALIARIEKAWSDTFPDYLFKYTFLDQTLNSFYQKEERLFELFKILAGIAIFIGCLGLYGVVAFMAESRTKEMGIRKAVGASAMNIFGLFSFDFVKLVLVALVIASPIAWYFMDQWLQDFTYKVHIGWWVYVAAGIFAIVIAMFTISFQTVKAALTNPVTALRSE